MKIGTTPIVSVKSGTTPIQKVFSGVNLIWSSVDPDAQAFITAASITDPTQQSAINTLVIGLKADGLWTKMKAIYPFVGSSATSNSYNLKNTAQYQITWNGGVTHSSTGVTFNGTNGYGNTGLIPSSVLTLNNSHLSIYSRTNNTPSRNDTIEIGAISSGARAILGLRNTSLKNTLIGSIDASNNATIINTDARGFYNITKNNSTTYKIFKNSILSTSNSGSALRPNVPLFIAALNNNGSVFADSYTNQEYTFSSIGDGLDDTEASNLYTRVQAFNTTLNRQV